MIPDSYCTLEVPNLCCWQNLDLVYIDRIRGLNWRWSFCQHHQKVIIFDDRKMLTYLVFVTTLAISAQNLIFGVCHQNLDTVSNMKMSPTSLWSFSNRKKSKTWLSIQTTPESETRLATGCWFNRFHVYESAFVNEHLYGCSKMEIFKNYCFQ